MIGLPTGQDTLLDYLGSHEVNYSSIAMHTMTYAIQEPLGIVAPDPGLLAKSKSAPSCVLAPGNPLNKPVEFVSYATSSLGTGTSHLKTLMAKVKSQAINAISRTDARPFCRLQIWLVKLV